MARVEESRILVGYRPDGSPIELPFIRVGSGKKRLFIAAVVHGDEITGLRSIFLLLDYLRSIDVHGEIGIVPVVNVEGFNYDTRGIPLSTVDLNRLYPGDERGYLPERITATVYGLARQYEFTVDMHTAGYSLPFILVDPAPAELKERIVEAAEATGVTVLEEYAGEKYERRRLTASLPGALIAEGRPSFTLELPSLYSPREPGVTVGFKALKNLLVHMGIVEDTVERITEYPVLPRGYRREDLVAEKPGVIEYHVDLGDKLDKGGKVATIRNLYGHPVEEVKMPREGYIVALNASHRAWTGSPVALIAVKS